MLVGEQASIVEYRASILYRSKWYVYVYVYVYIVAHQNLPGLDTSGMRQLGEDDGPVARR